MSLVLWILACEAWAVDCANIHAVKIALDQGLSDCDTDTIGASPVRLGRGCAGLTADACAEEHYLDAEDYVSNSGTGSFDLYFLSESLGLRCSDGTRPHFYYSPGVGATDRWLIYQNGSSGKCKQRLDPTSGVITGGGVPCYDEGGNSGFHLKDEWEGAGILKGDGALGLDNDTFEEWNRVWIPSCSNDQYQGTADHPSELVHLPVGGLPWNAPLYTQGFDIVMAVIDELGSGGYTHDLSDATLVALYGSSGGAGGLGMTLDAKAGHVQSLDAITPPRVVGLLDSRAEPNLAGAEALFDEDATTCTIFDDAASCAGFDMPPAGDEDAGFEFDASAYLPNTPSCTSCGSARIFVEWWGDNLDTSCASHHGLNDSQCYDVYHVLYHHTATPVFFATSLRDKNQHNNGIEYAIDPPGVSFADLDDPLDCGGLERERVLAQLESYHDHRDTVAGAHGESNGAGPIGIWALDWVDHEITKEDCLFLQAELDELTLSDAFNEWAVNQTEIYLMEDAAHAVRTFEPNCTEKTLSCPP